jgi:hypothetical protein
LNNAGKVKIDADYKFIDRECGIAIEQGKYARQNFWNCCISWIKRKNVNKE